MSKPSFIIHLGQSLPSGSYVLENNFFRQWGTSDPGLNLSLFTNCDIILDVHQTTHTSSGRIAGGILGAVVAGPLGAVAGLMTGGKKTIDKTEVYCSLNDGRGFKAVCSRESAAALKAAVLTAQRLNSSINVQRVGNEKKRKDPVEQTKDCPQCAETVKLKAKICRFCNHVFELDERQTMLESLKKDPEYLSFVSIFDNYRKLANVKIQDEDFESIYRICKCVSDKYISLHEDYEINQLAHAAKSYFERGCENFVNKYSDYKFPNSPDESPNGMILYLINDDSFAQCFTDGFDGDVEEEEMKVFLNSVFDKFGINKS